MDSNDTFDLGADPVKARRRILAQGVNILHSLIEAYNGGMLDDPNNSANLCTMFALVAEGRVTGNFDEDTGLTKWSLTDDYIQRLQKTEEMILGSKLIKGPWKNSVDKQVKT
jgi:hypothetical protein